MKFIVLSDCHIVQRDGLCNGLNPYARLEKAVVYINRFHDNAEAVICAGDLVDRTASDAYPVFFEVISDLKPPVRLTLGNHDDPERLSQHYPGPYYWSDVSAKRAVIALDSAFGELGEGQIAWLKDELQRAAKRPLLIVLHHNIAPLSLQAEGTSLRDASSLCAVLAAHSGPLHLVTGHAHTTASGIFQNVPFTTVSGGHFTIAHDGWRNGPGQLARVEMNSQSIIVEIEDFISSQELLTPTASFC